MMTASIHILKLRSRASDALLFDAEDADGALEVLVPYAMWEDFRAETPVPCTDEDQRDYALGMIEARAAEIGVAGDRTITLA